MESREKQLLGRKVFFLNPPLMVENNIIDLLKSEEYEVYVISDVACAKPMLRMCANAICFIYIDDILSLKGWFNFIKSFEEDDTLKTIFLGCLSIKTKDHDRENFLMNLKLPGGFVMMDRKVEKIYEQIDGILKINSAKGIRKCLRLEIQDSSETNGYFALGSFLYSFSMLDISPIGFAAVAPVKMAPIFEPERIISNVSITTGRYAFVCSIKIYKKLIKDDKCTIVCIFTDLTADIVRKIHNYVYEQLIARNKEEQSGLIKDLTDYEKLVIKKEENPESAADTEVSENIENAEDLPDLN